MKFKTPFKSATDRLISKEEERQLYEKAGLDIENNNIDKGLWIKALSKAEGDEVKQKGIYIELLVEHYKDEINAGNEISQELLTEANNEHIESGQYNFLDKASERFPITTASALLSIFPVAAYAWWYDPEIGFLGFILVLFVWLGPAYFFVTFIGFCLWISELFND